MKRIYTFLDTAGKNQPKEAESPKNADFLYGFLLEELTEYAVASNTVWPLIKAMGKALYDIVKTKLFKVYVLDKNGMLDAIVDMFWVLGNLSYFTGLTLEELDSQAKSVDIANFSKFCKTEAEAKQTVEKYRIEGKRLEDRKPYYVEHKGLWAVLASDGKILKSINWTPPNK